MKSLLLDPEELNGLFDVVGLGELLIDFTIVGSNASTPRSIRGSAGGAPANVLAAVTRLGGTARFIGKVGNDEFGAFLEGSLLDAGIDTEGLVRGDEATTLAFVQLDAQGERTFSFARNPGADTQLAVTEISDHCLKDSKVFHFGSLSLTNEPARSATWHGVERALSYGCLISFDPNLRPPLWPSLDLARQMMLEGIKLARIVKLSEQELQFLFGTDSIADGLKSIQSLNQTAVYLVTQGEQGCTYATPDFTGHVASIAVQPVDTTAAGDAFLGAFLYALTRGGSQALLQSEAQMRNLVRFANVAGGLTTTKSGSFSALPGLAEVEAML